MDAYVFTIVGTNCWNRFCNLRTTYKRTLKTKSGQGADSLTAREKWLSQRIGFVRKYGRPDAGIGRGGVSTLLCICELLMHIDWLPFIRKAELLQQNHHNI